jgi:phenylacetate-CoA ligase
MRGSRLQMGYWEQEIETMERRQLEEKQLERLRGTIASALNTAFYKKRLAEAGISSADEIRTLEDLRRVPFTTKDDLRSCFPDRHLAVTRDRVVRLHASSGTTGTPTVIYHTQPDVDQWANLNARSLAATGCTSRDVLQNMMTYGLFTGGLGLHYGAEKLGMLVIPASSGNTKRQLRLMQDFGTTVVHATPSYMLHIASRLEDEGVTPEELPLKKAMVGAEPHSEEIRLKIQQIFGIDVYNSYGLSEMNGPGVAFECQEKRGMHVWEDAYILEIIDPETQEPVPDGEEGELVFTVLGREATPLLRYRTRDLSMAYADSCPCGRTHRRIARIKGRTDDMLIINGVNVYPSQIEEVLMKMPEVGTNYQIVISKRGALDHMVVKTEVTEEMFSDDARDLNALRERIRENMRASIAMGAAVELHEPGVLPVSEGKAIRVVDNREQEVMT